MLTDEQIAQFGYAHSDEHDEPLFAFDRAGFIACVRALLAGQPAAIDKEAVAICTICNGYGRYQDGDSGTEADGYAPNIVECECADEERRPEYRVTATSANVAQGAEAVLPAWFDVFLTNVCEIPDRNSPDDEPEAIVATLEELKSCALNAIEQCALPAQTAPTDDARDLFIRDIAQQKPEKPDHWNSCRQCEHNIERAQDILTAAQSASGDTK